MLINYLIIPILLAISVREAVTLKDLNSAANATDEEAKRLATSELIREYMNESIDPCEDFYQFTCGNWRTRHALYSCLEEFNSILIELFEQPDDKYTKSEWKVKDFYDSCEKMYTLTVSDHRRSMATLIKEFGRMPALEGKKWQDKKFDWIKTIGEISHKYDIGIIFGYKISDNDGNDPTANYLIMKSQLLLKFRDTSAETLNWHKLAVEEALKYSLRITTKTAKQTAKEIVDFELKLFHANEKVKNANEEDDELLETTFEEMHRKYSRSLDVMKLVNTSFGHIPAGVVIDDNPSYVEALGTIVRKTPKRVLANYIFYALMQNFEPLLPSCLEATKTHFLPILSNMVYRRSHLTEKEQEFHRIWHGITQTLQHSLESNRLSWFDDDSREAALEKLHLMKLYIASYEDMNFDELYRDLKFNSSDFVENIKSIKFVNAKQTRKSLNERRSAKHSLIGDFSASYMPSANAVRFPMSSLVKDCMWLENAPHALNYGRLGTTIAHEIVHGFTGAGRSFNRLGIYIEGVYKDIEDSYEERRQCYYDQYHNFTLNNKPLHQDVSQDENISDNAGIYLAYHTYLRWLADEARTQQELNIETLPQSNYTNKQLFFIGYSQFWCSSNYYGLASDDPHTPDEFRGFVPLLNFGEFAKEFNCPIGSRMNPRKKCSIY